MADLRTPFVKDIDGMGIYVFYCIYVILYGGRGIVFAMVSHPSLEQRRDPN